VAADFGPIVRAVLEATSGGASNVKERAPAGSDGALSGARGVAVGAALAALAPLAGKKLIEAVDPTAVADKVTHEVGDQLTQAATKKLDEIGGPGGIVKAVGKSLLPGGGSKASGGGQQGIAGVGKGRRMPVQQAIDIGVPLETVYNQWTQFEEWPNFMQRITRATQEDDCTVSFAVKLWGFTREFTAEIETQRPDERIKWSVTQGPSQAGVVTFHEISDHLTRIEVNLDLDPGSLLEKAARGMRHVKRAVRADLHRFKAYIEMEEQETGAWRGVIEEGELVEAHPQEYDQQREYSDRASRDGRGGSRKTSKRRSGGKASQSSRSRKQGGKRATSSNRSSASSPRKSSSSSGRSRSSSRGQARSSNKSQSGGGSKRLRRSS
jgi:uncharacterized membrane protein